MRRSIALLSLVCIASSALAGLGDVPDSILKKLTRGVNVTRWYCYQGKYDANQFENYFTPGDINALKNLEVKWIRLCVAPPAIYDAGKPISTNMDFLEKSIKQLNNTGFLVVLDLHDNGQLKLDEPNHDNSGFVSFWQAVAKRFKGLSRDKVVYELVNEPVFTKDSSPWYKLQNETVNAIRAIDPKRTLMVSPTSWSGIDALAKMQKLPQKNLIYTYHCYDPFFFTHQGATWLGDWPGKLKSMPFPSSPEAVADALTKNEPRFADTIRDFGKNKFDARYLYNRLKIGIDWGKANKVPVVLGEFGSFPAQAPVQSRMNWFAAMRNAIDELKLPNAIWGYDDGFGLGRKLENGKVVLDPVTLKSFFRK